MKYLKLLLLASIFIIGKAFSNPSVVELKLAIDSNISQEVKRVFSDDKIYGVTDFEGLPPLHYAIRKGHFFSAMALIESGVDLTLENDNGHKALVDLCMRDDDNGMRVPIIKKFIEAGVSFESSNPQRWSYLSGCGSRPDVMRTIAEEKVYFDINKKDIRYPTLGTVLNSMISDGITPDVLELLSYTKPDFTFRGDSGETLLHTAVSSTATHLRTNPDIIKYLVDKGVNVNARDDYSRTPLMQAVFTESLPHVKALVEAGAIIRLKNKRPIEKNSTALDYLSRKLEKSSTGYIYGKNKAKEIYRYLMEQNDIQTL